MRKAEWALLILVVAAFVIAGLAYPYMPTTVATHWNASGQVNGTMSRAWGAFILPLVFLLVAVLLLIIPRIDPRHEHIMEFRKYFDYFLVGFGILFLFIECITVAANLGWPFDVRIAIVPPLAGLFYLIGAIMPHLKSNFTIGIRTPWTLSSEYVWKKTHEVGGIAFRFAAIVSLLGMVFPGAMVWCFVAPLIAAAIYVTVYSYVVYARERRA